jgi:hypothetical protein
LSKRTRLLERTKNYTKKTRAGHRRIGKEMKKILAVEIIKRGTSVKGEREEVRTNKTTSGGKPSDLETDGDPAH